MSFQKKFSECDTPDPHSGRGQPPPVPNTQPGRWPGAGHKRPGVGTQTLVPLNFSAVVAPLTAANQWTDRIMPSAISRRSAMESRLETSIVPLYNASFLRASMLLC